MNLKRNSMQDSKMTEQIEHGQGFIAALDQSGGSTPGALKGYGIGEDSYSTDEEMFTLIHAMRARILQFCNSVNIGCAPTRYRAVVLTSCHKIDILI